MVPQNCYLPLVVGLKRWKHYSCVSVYAWCVILYQWEGNGSLKKEDIWSSSAHVINIHINLQHYITALISGEKSMCRFCCEGVDVLWNCATFSFLLLVSFQKQHGDVPPRQLRPHRDRWHDTTPRHMVKPSLYLLSHPVLDTVSKHVENKTTAQTLKIDVEGENEFYKG